MNNVSEIEQLFATEMIRIRKAEEEAANMTNQELLDNHSIVKQIVSEIVAAK
jgi:hypothetical protein